MLQHFGANPLRCSGPTKLGGTMRTYTYRAPMCALAAAVGMACGVGRTASAQQPQTADANPSAGLEEITVTGTRIRRDGYTAPTPTTVVDNNFMESLGIGTRSEERR